MLFALMNLSPLFVIVYENSENEAMFWNRLMQVINSLTGKLIIPSPIKNFPDFVIFLYQNQEFLQLKTQKLKSIFETVKVFLELVQNKIDAKFLLWRFPEILSDPILYINILYELNATRHIIMRNFTTTTGNVDLLFDRLIPFLTKSAPVSLIELLISIFVEKIRFITNQTDIASSLFDHFIQIFPSNNISLSISAFRAATFIFILTRGRFDHEHHREWLNQIIDASYSIFHISELGINFAIENRVDGYTKLQLCQKIIEQPIINPYCISYITKILLGRKVSDGYENSNDKNNSLNEKSKSNLTKCLNVIQFFFELGVKNPFYRQICISNLKILHERAIDKNYQVWILCFIRKSFEFVALSQMANKYINRKENIYNFYNSLYLLNIEYISKYLSVCYTSLLKSGIICPQNLLIRDDGLYDPEFINTIQQLTKKAINLKQYLQNVQIPENLKPQVSSKLAVKAKTLNSQKNVSFFRNSKPPITSPSPGIKKNVSLRNNSLMRQSKSTNFKQSPNCYRK